GGGVGNGSQGKPDLVHSGHGGNEGGDGHPNQSNNDVNGGGGGKVTPAMVARKNIDSRGNDDPNGGGVVRSCIAHVRMEYGITQGPIRSSIGITIGKAGDGSVSTAKMLDVGEVVSKNRVLLLLQSLLGESRKIPCCLLKTP
ncbi:hypothetical protein KI387_040588, partial [Taxus chinensis]